jgi:hypothetical protein
LFSVKIKVFGVCEGINDTAPLAEFIRNSWTVHYDERIVIDLPSDKSLGDIVKQFSEIPSEFMKETQSIAEHRRAPPSTAEHRRAPPSTAEHRRAPPSTAGHVPSALGCRLSTVDCRLSAVGARSSHPISSHPACSHGSWAIFLTSSRSL